MSPLFFILLVGVAAFFVFKGQKGTKDKKQEDFLQWLHQGVMLDRAGDLSGALAAFNTAISINPDAADGYFNRGLLHRKRLANNLATADFAKVIEIGLISEVPFLQEAYINRAICYSYSQNYQQAANDWDAAIHLNPLSHALYFERSRIRYLLEDYKGAIEDLNEAIVLEPTLPLLYAARATYYAKIEEQDNAIRDFSQAIAFAPTNLTPIHYERGRIYAKREQWDEALADMKAAIQHNFNKPEWAYASIGNILRLEKQQYAEAIQAYDAALEINSQSIHAYVGRGQTYSKMREYDKAIADYSKALEIEPENATAYNNRGYLYARLEQYEPSLADCNKAISIDPLKANHFGSRGHTFFLIESYSRALADFQKAQEINPEHKFALAGAALCHYQLGQMDEAKNLWKSVIEQDDAYKQASAIQDEYDCHPRLVEVAEKVIALL